MSSLRTRPRAFLPAGRRVSSLIPRAVLIALACVALGATPVVAWTTPVKVSEMTGTLSMAVDSNGYVHAAFSRATWGIYYITNAPNGTWKPWVRVTQQWDEHPSLALDTSNNVHIAFDRKYDYGDVIEDAGIWIVKKIGNGPWTASTKHATVGGDHSPSLRIRTNNRQYIAFIKSGDGVWLSNNETGSWSTSKAWTDTGLDDSASAPSLRVAVANQPHIAYQTSLGRIAYLWYTTLWNRTVISAGPEDRAPALVLGPSSKPHVAFLAKGNCEISCTSYLKYRHKVGTGWSTTKMVTESGEMYPPSLVVDGNQRVAIVLGAGGDLWRHTNETGNWPGTWGASVRSTHTAASTQVKFNLAGKEVILYERLPDPVAVGGTFLTQE